MRGNAQQMGRLVDDLLAFAHLGRQPIKKQTVDSVRLVQQTVDELRSEQDWQTSRDHHGRPAALRRRSGPAQAGLDQPALQRDQIHSGPRGRDDRGRLPK